LLGAATGDAFAVAATYYETAIQKRGNDSNTFRRAQDFFRNALVGRALNFRENSTRSLDASARFRIVIASLAFFVSGKNRGQQTKEQQ
jgi:hypothetical protein